MRAPAGVVSCLLLAGCSPAPPPPKAETTAPPPPTILQFYASPGTVAKGDRALICYGVEQAASVRIEPAVEEITPSRARCIEVRPAASNTYTLYARNAAGEEVSQQLEIVVDAKAVSTQAKQRASGAMIQFFSLGGPAKVAKGATVTLCYGVTGATAVSLTPAVLSLIPSERLCFQVNPQETMTYTLTATSAAGGKDSETVRVVVE